MNDQKEIAVNDNTILKEINPTFEHHQKQNTFASVNYIDNEAQLCERVNYVGLVFKISSIEHIEKDGKTLHLQKASLQDNTDDVPITFFGILVHHIEKKTVHSLTNLRVSKYMFTRLLTTTKSTKITTSDKEI